MNMNIYTVNIRERGRYMYYNIRIFAFHHICILRHILRFFPRSWNIASLLYAFLIVAYYNIQTLAQWNFISYVFSLWFMSSFETRKREVHDSPLIYYANGPMFHTDEMIHLHIFSGNEPCNFGFGSKRNQ